MSTIVYRYGLLGPTESAELVRGELRQAYDYRRALARIENERRTAIRVAVHLAAAGVAELEVTAQEAERAESLAYDSARATPTDETRSVHDAAKAARIAAMNALHEARRRAERSPEGRATLAAIRTLHEGEIKSAYGARTCAWGTAALAKKSHEQACSDRHELYDGVRPKNLWVPDFDGTGAIRVQIQGGAGIADVSTGNRYARIERREFVGKSPDRIVRFGKNAGRRIGDVHAEHARGIPTGPASEATRERWERRQASKDVRTLRLRLDSDDSRQPIFGSWPMTYDRPIPTHAQIKEVIVYLRRVADREVWSVSFVCDVVHERAADLGHGAVAIDLGWRRVRGGLRVGYAVGEDGARRELVLPDAIMESFRYADAVRSTRDEMFNRVVAGVLRLRQSGHAAEWWMRETRTAHAWKSHAPLAALVPRWASERFAGDEDLFDRIEWWGEGAAPKATWRAGLPGWAAHDLHLDRIEDGTRARAQRRREDLYRNWALELTRRYEALVLEEFDISEIAKRYPGDHADGAQSQRQLASVSELVTALQQTFIRRGGCGRGKVDASYSSHTCADCGHLQGFDAARSISWTCAGCGVIHDQDENAARVALSRERWCDAKSTERARVVSKSCVCHEKREPHFARLKRLKAEKVAREGGAREPTGKSAE